MQQGEATTATEGITRRTDVPRAELLLSGNRVRSLLDSLLIWSQSRLGVRGHALYVADEAGGLQWLAEAGELDREAADALAQARWRGDAALHRGVWLAMDLCDAGQCLGVLICQFRQSVDDTVRDAMGSAASLFAQRLPGALELERLSRAMEQLAEAERLQRALYMIADLASGGRDMDEVLATIHGIVAGLMYAENFYIALYDAQHQLVRLPYFRDSVDEDPPVGQASSVDEWEGSLTLHALRTGKTMMGPSDELLRENGLKPGGFGPQSEAWLGVPMMRDTEVIGVLVVQSYDRARRYGEKERALLNFVAQHVATALDRLRTHEELERRVHERTEELNAANRALRAQVRERERAEKLQAALFRIAELGSTSGSLEAFYASLHAVIGELIHARNFYIALLSEDGEQLDFPYSVDERDRVRKSRTVGHGLTEYVLRTGQALLASRAVIESLERQGELRSHGTMSATWLGVPLIYDNRTVGVMATQSYDDTHTYSQRDQDILTFVSYHIANALQRKQQADFLREANAVLEQRVRERTEALASINEALRNQIAERERAERRLRHAALHDALTGLPNRSLLLDRMGQALERYRRDRSAVFAVLFLDLDRFKVVNDSVGHLVGDELLKAAGGRIRARLPEEAMIARLGGDEFAVLLETSDASQQAPAIARDIIDALEEPLRIAGKDIYSSASIGITFAQPHYRTAEELLRDADVALYRAKANGRRRYEIFDETLRRQVLLQMELESNLRRALARREFEPLFQPIFDLHSGKVMGFEALLRWRHPQYGLIAPGEFLGQAEESGMVEAIDWQVYDSAFAQTEALLGSHAYLGINVGARHLRSVQFVDTLLQRLDAAGFNPAQLRIEVTESVLLEDPVQSRALMERLGSYGISVALDDFGTGYSSLSYLHQFPLQALKIDRSFIAPLDSDAPGNSPTVMRAIHALGAELGLEVIAEGIETQAQLDQVKKLGSVCGQGFLLARPASVHSLLAAGLAAR
ncbi:EAL domain-containing protein [Xanthomonadaceae bacterium JHOS43]|nr:EAL domain-containing protein [Xanthomonadaceae bacterium JHOS43]MCX7562487.1 EAL domain-containing protein [Xanthomonadaceae bacterium XH05]